MLPLLGMFGSPRQAPRGGAGSRSFPCAGSMALWARPLPLGRPPSLPDPRPPPRPGRAGSRVGDRADRWAPIPGRQPAAFWGVLVVRCFLWSSTERDVRKRDLGVRFRSLESDLTCSGRGRSAGVCARSFASDFHVSLVISLGFLVLVSNQCCTIKVVSPDRTLHWHQCGEKSSAQ